MKQTLPALNNGVATEKPRFGAIVAIFAIGVRSGRSHDGERRTSGGNVHEVNVVINYDPSDVIALDKNTAIPFATSKTIGDDVTLTLPYAYFFIRDFFCLYQY